MPSGGPSKRLWTILLVLAPVAAIAGSWLIARHSTAAGLQLATSRQEVLAAAHALAAERGIDTTGWKQLSDLRVDNVLRHYLSALPPSERAALEPIVQPAVWRAVLIGDDATPPPIVRVDVAPDGRIVSYRLPPAEVKATEGEADANAAMRELTRRLGDRASAFALAVSSVERHGGLELHRFTYRHRHGADLTLAAIIRFRGTTPVSFTLAPQFAPGYVERIPQLRPSWQSAKTVFITLIALAGLVYVAVRFIKRVREQEIPLRRSLTVGLIVFVAYAGMMILVGSQTQQIAAIEGGSGTSATSVVIGFFVGALMMGALAALTWGACEADIREAYPEKLISTDALLGGQMLSATVRASLVAALAIACYVVLLAGLDVYLRASFGMWTRITEGELIPHASHRPVLAVVLLSLSGLPLTIVAFMTAISVTHRRGRTRRAQWATAALIVGFSAVGMATNHSPVAWSIVAGALLATQLLAPFLLADLLAVVITSATVTWAAFASSLLGQPSETFQNAGRGLLATLVVAFAIAAIAFFRRRPAESAAAADALRPEYARNISERLSLAAEMSTAREAQLRVIPRRPPSIPGVAIAVRHSEAGDIGTDYCELFPSGSRIGIAIAEARLPGLSSALCVSMLKGLLLNYTNRFDDPDEIVKRVQKRLTLVFGDDLPLSLLYGVFDRETGTIRCATLGGAPAAIVVGNGSARRVDSGPGRTFANDDAVVVYTAGAAGGDSLDAVREQLDALGTTDPEALVASVAEHAKRTLREEVHSWSVLAISSRRETAA